MGWSNALGIDYGQDFYDPGQYREVDATWFQKSWWGHSIWAWEYINDTGQPLRITKATFKGCAGHSNGKLYCGAYGAGATLTSNGYGCTFTSDLYVINAQWDRVGGKKDIGRCGIPNIGEYNCYYNGYGKVSTSTPRTSYGLESLFGPNSGHYVAGGWREGRTINYADAPIVPPLGRLYVHIRPISWNTSSNNALLVLEQASSKFTSEFEPEDQEYIWVVTGDHVWKKKKKAHMLTNTGWEEMKGN